MGEKEKEREREIVKVAKFGLGEKYYVRGGKLVLKIISTTTHFNVAVCARTTTTLSASVARKAGLIFTFLYF